MKKIYITWEITKHSGDLFWHTTMKISAPYDWMKDDGGIPWNDFISFTTLTTDRATKFVNQKIYAIKENYDYPIELVFPSTQGQNIDWA